MISGRGGNAHGARVPIKALMALGMTWIRRDLPPEMMTADHILPLMEHDKALKFRLWILPQGVKDVVSTAQLMVKCGIAEIELFNEPMYAGINPEEYGEIYRKVKSVVGPKVTVYFGSLPTWSPEAKAWLKRALKTAGKVDAVAFHGYVGKPELLRDAIRELQALGLRVVCTENGYPQMLGPNRYAIDMRASGVELYVRAKAAFKRTPWCWFDMPNDNGQGFFDWDPETGDFTKPNDFYWDCLLAS